MHFPRLPDWLVYGAAVLALLIAAIGRQEKADAPAPPPPMSGAAGVPLSAYLPFDPARVLKVGPQKVAPQTGTAFSVSEAGVWLTAGHVLEGCRQAAIVVAEGRGVQASVMIDRRRDIAILRTEGGAPALPIGGADLGSGDRGYQPGFPSGRAGEVASRLLGSDRLPARSRRDPPMKVLAWTEIGRTDGLKGMLDGLSGAPVLNESGQVVGLTLAESPRRGRIYTTSPGSIQAALKAAGVRPSPLAKGQPINVENYGRAADSLRRDLRIAKAVCLRT